MKQFNLEQYLQKPNKKVTTRYGNRKVRIICTDRKDNNNKPIISLMEDSEGNEYTTFHTINGFVDGEEKYPDKRDLFFLGEEEELTEFEKGMKCIIRDIKNGDAVEDYKFWSQRLLDLARKQLQPDIDKEIDNAYKTRDEVVYFEGYEKGKEDALKEKSFVDINKACKWMNEHLPYWFNEEELLKDFRKAMKEYQTPCHGVGNCEFEASQAALETAKWKDMQYEEEKKQWISKACDWLIKNSSKYVHLYEDDFLVHAYKTMSEDFKKAMEE